LLPALFDTLTSITSIDSPINTDLHKVVFDSIFDIDPDGVSTFRTNRKMPVSCRPRYFVDGNSNPNFYPIYLWFLTDSLSTAVTELVVDGWVGIDFRLC